MKCTRPVTAILPGGSRRLWMDCEHSKILVAQHPSHSICISRAQTQVNHFASAFRWLAPIGAHSENLSILLGYQLSDCRKLRGVSLERQIDSSNAFFCGAEHFGEGAQQVCRGDDSNQLAAVDDRQRADLVLD